MKNKVQYVQNSSGSPNQENTFGKKPYNAKQIEYDIQEALDQHNQDGWRLVNGSYPEGKNVAVLFFEKES